MQSPTREESGRTVTRNADEETIDRALAWHGGDARATIATLLADCGYLRGQLAFAFRMMGHGFSRGWAPASCQGDNRAPDGPASEIAAAPPGIGQP